MGQSVSGEAYITRMAESKCSMGTCPQLLNLPMDHGVVYSSNGDPLMNANDHIPNQHILPYGMCKATWGFCTPVTPLAWIGGNNKHYLDGAPALIEKSKLTCAFGGIITITPPKSGNAEVDGPEESSEDYWSELLMIGDALLPTPIIGSFFKTVAMARATLGMNDQEPEK